VGKLYLKLRAKIRAVEDRLSLILAKRASEPYESRVFYFNLLWLNQVLFFLESVSTLLKWVMVLTYDPGESFNILFRQRELRSCPYSYINFKNIRHQVHFFSLSTASTIVVVSVVTSLVTNFLFGGKNPTEAATFGWTQGSWVTASTTAKASHSTNQAGWNYFYSKDAGISTSSGVISIATANTSWTQTSNADFLTSTFNNTIATSGTIKLLKPKGATCLTDSECYVGGFCYDNLNCGEVWTSSSTNAALCGGIKVYYLDMSWQWKTSNTACDTPQCGLNGAQEDDLVSSNTVDFSLYPARNACKAVGGRLPTKTEMLCIYANKSSYRKNFQSTRYWTASEANTTSSWDVDMSNGNSYSSYWKDSTLPVRCVK